MIVTAAIHIALAILIFLSIFANFAIARMNKARASA